MDTNKSTYTDQVAPLQLTSRTIHDQFVSRDMSQRWGRNVLNPRLTITSYQDSPAITIASAAPVVPWMTTVKKSPAPRRNTLKEFAKASSLHGIKYLAEEDRHFTEIIFWSVANGLAFICVVYFICEVNFSPCSRSNGHFHKQDLEESSKCTYLLYSVSQSKMSERG